VLCFNCSYGNNVIWCVCVYSNSCAAVCVYSNSCAAVCVYSNSCAAVCAYSNGCEYHLLTHPVADRWWQNHRKAPKNMRQNENLFSLIDSKTVRFIRKSVYMRMCSVQRVLHTTYVQYTFSVQNVFGTTCIQNQWMFHFSATWLQHFVP
jgi:hypothetical protein